MKFKRDTERQFAHKTKHRSASENSQTGGPAVQTGCTSNGGCFQKRLSLSDSCTLGPISEQRRCNAAKNVSALPDRQPDPWTMLNASLNRSQVNASVEQTIDLAAVLRPLLHLVEVALVSIERIVGFFVRPVLSHSGNIVICSPTRWAGAVPLVQLMSKRHGQGGFTHHSGSSRSDGGNADRSVAQVGCDPRRRA
jgi:hypothetical protein